AVEGGTRCAGRAEDPAAGYCPDRWATWCCDRSGGAVASPGAGVGASAPGHPSGPTESPGGFPRRGFWAVAVTTPSPDRPNSPDPGDPVGHTDLVGEILLTQDEIQAKIRELGKRITE